MRFEHRVRSFVTLSLVLVAIGCATPLSPVPPVEGRGRKATVVVAHGWQLFGFMTPAALVGLDGKPIAYLSSGEFTRFDLPFGEHRISVLTRFGALSTLTLDLDHRGPHYALVDRLPVLGITIIRRMNPPPSPSRLGEFVPPGPNPNSP